MRLANDMRPGSIAGFGAMMLLIAGCLFIATASTVQKQHYDYDECVADPQNIQDYGAKGVSRYCVSYDPTGGMMVGYTFAVLFGLPTAAAGYNLLTVGRLNR